MNQFPSTDPYEQSICIILAGGHSERLKDKNKQVVDGLSLLARSIRLAKRADCFNEIVVSTDDRDLEEIAIGEGVVCQWRPQHLCGPKIRTYEVFEGTLEGHERYYQKRYKYGCCFLATNIFVPVWWIRQQFNLLVTPAENAVGKALAWGMVEGPNDSYPYFVRLTRAAAFYPKIRTAKVDGLIDLDIHVEGDLHIARSIQGLIKTGVISDPMGGDVLQPPPKPYYEEARPGNEPDYVGKNYAPAQSKGSSLDHATLSGLEEPDLEFAEGK